MTPVAVTLVSEISIFWYRYRPPLSFMQIRIEHAETAGGTRARESRKEGETVLGGEPTPTP